MNSKLIETEPIGRDGEECEQKIWKACKAAFKERDCIAYWHYPIFYKTGEKRKEPDIIIVDRELGVIIIEVKCINIDQIMDIDGPNWVYRNFYDKSGNPYAQAENGLYAIISYINRENLIRKKVRGRAIVALPKINEEQWQKAGYDQKPGSPPILFNKKLGPKTLLDTIINSTPVEPGVNLSEDQWNLLLAVIGGSQVMRKQEPDPLSLANSNTFNNNETSRIEVINTLNKRLYEIDLQQVHIGMEIPPGMQRIRGIAGSGKTVLLCQKAASMYLKHPEWDIAFVFFTRSLYDQIESLIDRWIRHFSCGEVSYRNNSHAQSKLKIFHAWGAKNRPGFYRYVCENHNISALGVSNTDYRQPNEGLADICNRLLTKNKSLKQIFDAILIDEGQDLVVDPDELKFEGKQSIYWMAYQVLKPCNQNSPLQRRLIWAYDEAQSLDTQKIPSAKELFGDNSDINKLISQRYKGNIKPSEIMHRCYRTPGQILTAAHAIGMGLMRPDGMLSGITNADDWKAIGYEVKQGDFRKKDEEIILHRPPENSPNPVCSLWNEPVIQLKIYETRQQELEELAKNINKNIKIEKLDPSRQILVLILGSNYSALKLETEVSSFLIQNGIDVFIPSGTRLNQLKPKYPDNDPDSFWYPGGVTVSRIPRAKGNEAEMVYVVGLDSIAAEEENIQLRNQLFVALTRSRCWSFMSGTGYYPLYDEIKEVLKSGDTFRFRYKNPPRRDIEDSEKISDDPEEE